MNSAPLKYADLHLHTLFSDGTYSPAELILGAVKRDIMVISVTDHDTVDAVAPALEAGKVNGVEVLPGIELTAEYDGLEIHILGYLIDYTDKALLEKLNSLKKDRVNRIYKIVDKLNGLGVKLSADSVFNLAKGGVAGRLHIARAMVKERLVGSTGEAFQRYIGDKCPAYVAGFRFSPQDAIKLIRGVGGIAVLAHPYLIRRDELILEFAGYGLMGLEVYYPEHTQAMVNFFLDLAKKYNLLVTGGSDCHGDAKPEVKIGSIKIPYILVEALKAAGERL